MFAKPTSRKSSGRKNHDRGVAGDETLDLTTTPALRRALQNASLPEIAEKADCRTADIIPFVKGKQSNLPMGLRTRVRQALVAFNEERHQERIERENAPAPQATVQPISADQAAGILDDDPDWLKRALRANAAGVRP